MRYFCVKRKSRIMEKNTKSTVQLICAVFLVVIGAGLLIAGFIVPPTGEVHSSVLVAFGETLTFAGAIFGIDYRYKK